MFKITSIFPVSLVKDIADAVAAIRAYIEAHGVGGSPASPDTSIQFNDAGSFGAATDYEGQPIFFYNQTTRNFEYKNYDVHILPPTSAAVSLNYGSGGYVTTGGGALWAFQIWKVRTIGGVDYRSDDFISAGIADDDSGRSMTITLTITDAAYNPATDFYVAELQEQEFYGTPFDGSGNYIIMNGLTRTLTEGTTADIDGNNLYSAYPQQNKRSTGTVIINCGTTGYDGTSAIIYGGLKIKNINNSYGNLDVEAALSCYSFTTAGNLVGGTILTNTGGSQGTPGLNVGEFGTGIYTTDQTGTPTWSHSMGFVLKNPAGIDSHLFKVRFGTYAAPTELSTNFFTMQDNVSFWYYNPTTGAVTQIFNYKQAGFQSLVGYKSTDGSAGITTTITTASLVGKTITVKNGLITGFA